MSAGFLTKSFHFFVAFFLTCHSEFSINDDIWGAAMLGVDAIIEKLKGIGKFTHNVKTIDECCVGWLFFVLCNPVNSQLYAFHILSFSPPIDVQPSPDQQQIVCIFVIVISNIDGGQPLHFCEFLQLVEPGGGNYYIHNSIDSTMDFRTVSGQICSNRSRPLGTGNLWWDMEPIGVSRGFFAMCSNY